MKYVHTNIISNDWKKLASFYIQAFDCRMVLPQRRLSGAWLAKGTGVKNAEINGAHLRLPGYGHEGPTLEIFEYSQMEEQPTPLANRKGLGHIAFEVENVQQSVEKALQFGGKQYGKIATKEVYGVGKLTFTYIKDPEGNIIEIQNWGRPVEKIDSPKQEEVQLPSDEDEVVTVKGAAEANKPAPHPQKKKGPKTKRELLDELYADLEASQQDIEATKKEIKRTKKASKKSNKTTSVEDHIQKLNRIKAETAKRKKELLEELKKEMKMEEENSKIAINLSHKNKPQKPSKKESPKATYQPSITPALTIEIKTTEDTKLLDLSSLALRTAPASIAQNLHGLTSQKQAKQSSTLLIEWLGQQYKADTVPLLKQYHSKMDRLEKEKTWVLVPRLRDSLQHLLGKCKDMPKILGKMNLSTIDLTPEGFVTTYQDLQTIVQAAEAQSATHIRLSYTNNK